MLRRRVTDDVVSITTQNIDTGGTTNVVTVTLKEKDVPSPAKSQRLVEHHHDPLTFNHKPHHYTQCVSHQADEQEDEKGGEREEEIDQEQEHDELESHDYDEGWNSDTPSVIQSDTQSDNYGDVDYENEEDEEDEEDIESSAAVEAGEQSSFQEYNQDGLDSDNSDELQVTREQKYPRQHTSVYQQMPTHHRYPLRHPQQHTQYMSDQGHQGHQGHHVRSRNPRGFSHSSAYTGHASHGSHTGSHKGHHHKHNAGISKDSKDSKSHTHASKLPFNFFGAFGHSNTKPTKNKPSQSKKKKKPPSKALTQPGVNWRQWVAPMMTSLKNSVQRRFQPHSSSKPIDTAHTISDTEDSDDHHIQTHRSMRNIMGSNNTGPLVVVNSATPQQLSNIPNTQLPNTVALSQIKDTSTNISSDLLIRDILVKRPLVVDWQKFCGATWYDIAHIPPWSEFPGPSRNITATYTLITPRILPWDNNVKPRNNNVRFKVHNSCTTAVGGISQITGEARVNTKYMPHNLGDPLIKARVDFPMLFGLLFGSAVHIRGDYWVYHIQEAEDPKDPYRWAIVSEPHKQHCWILARTPRMSTEELMHARNIVTSIGISAERLVFTEHDLPK